MELNKFKVSGKEIEFVNSSRNTSSGFAHDSVLFIDNVQRGKYTVHYLNRTWEAYRYQSVMIGLVRGLIEDRKKYLLGKFKTEKGYSKLTAKRSEEFEATIKDDAGITLYNKILAKLRKY